MSVIPSKWCARIALISIVPLLVSCNAVQLSYNNADIWLRWKADSYFDLRPQQEAELRVRMSRFHEWHRSHELAVYAELMRSAANRLEDGLSEQDVTWAIENVRARYQVLMVQAVADGAFILTSLSPEQLAHLERKFADDNRKYAKEFLPSSEDQRAKVRAQRIEEWLAEWTGSLNAEQEQRIALMARATFDRANTKLAEREHNQREFIDILKSERAVESLAPRLSDLLENWESRRTPAQVNEAKLAEAQFARMMVDVDRILTPAQRANAVNRLRSYAADFAALVDVRSAPAQMADEVPGNN